MRRSELSSSSDTLHLYSAKCESLIHEVRIRNEQSPSHHLKFQSSRAPSWRSRCSVRHSSFSRFLGLIRLNSHVFQKAAVPRKINRQLPILPIPLRCFDSQLLIVIPKRHTDAIKSRSAAKDRPAPTNHFPREVFHNVSNHLSPPW